MELILLALLAAAPPVAPMALDGCRVAEQPPMSEWPFDADTGLRTLVRMLDVDGDGANDVILVTGGSGSGSSQRTARVELASGAAYEAIATFPFDAMVTRVPVPAPVAAAPAPVREALEDALFDRVCAAPDPSLAWLLGERDAVRWVAGPPALPENYAIYTLDEEAPVWISYLGWTHRMERRGRPLLRAVGEVGDVELLTTAHGVLLWDGAGDRHAWLYVFGGAPGHKLRWESVRQVEVLGRSVEVKVGEPIGEMETFRANLDRLGAFPAPPPAEE